MGGYDLGDVISGDFNGDGYDDLNYSHILATRLTVLSRGQGLSAVATGDLNHDGKSDIVVIHSSTDRVKLLFGDGDNNFQRTSDLFTDLKPS